MIADGALYPLRPLKRPTSEIAGGYLPTPTAQMGEYNQSPNSNKKRLTLVGMARKNQWPTPTASDATKWSNESLEERVSKGRQVRLNTAVSPQGGLGGQLNPTWVEWLMGYPIGWTEYEDWAMRGCQRKPAKRLKC
jgi:hypothetical protein